MMMKGWEEGAKFLKKLMTLSMNDPCLEKDFGGLNSVNVIFGFDEFSKSLII